MSVASAVFCIYTTVGLVLLIILGAWVEKNKESTIDFKTDHLNQVVYDWQQVPYVDIYVVDNERPC